MPATASGMSWQPERHSIPMPSAGSEHSRLPHQMLPAELPAHHSGIGQAGPPPADAPDRQAADQALQQAPPGLAAQTEPRQHNEAVPDAQPQLVMNSQLEAEAWGVRKGPAGQGPAANMPPLAEHLARAGAAPVGIEVPHSTRGYPAAWLSGTPLADSHWLAPPLVAAAVQSQAQWLGSPAPGQQPQASSMPPIINALGAVPALTQQMPAVSSAALVHDSAAMTAAAQPASWRNSAQAPHSQQPRDMSRLPSSGHQPLTLLPSLPAAPMPHQADTDGDTLQQLIARAERLRLMLDRAAGGQAALDWQR